MMMKLNALPAFWFQMVKHGVSTNGYATSIAKKRLLGETFC
jgi:hypothetical protein